MFKKKYTALLVAGLALLAVVGLSFVFLPDTINTGETKIKIGNAEWRVEIANNEFSRAQGLSGRQSLPEDAGMLFLFNQADIHKFWMRDMKFPLDIVWINDDKVVDISDNLPPASLDDLKIYSPKEPANLVLEINAGQIDRYGIKIGDPVKIYNNGTLVLY